MDQLRSPMTMSSTWMHSTMPGSLTALAEIDCVWNTTPSSEHSAKGKTSSHQHALDGKTELMAPPPGTMKKRTTTTSIQTRAQESLVTSLRWFGTRPAELVAPRPAITWYAATKNEATAASSLRRTQRATTRTVKM